MTLRTQNAPGPPPNPHHARDNQDQDAVLSMMVWEEVLNFASLEDLAGL